MSRPRWWILAVLAILPFIVLGMVRPVDLGPGSSTVAGAPEAVPATHLAPLSAPPGRAAPLVSLTISASPSEICAGDLGRCPALSGESTVSLAVQAGVKGHNAWPAAQILFVVETTPYDGVYDPSASVPGSDPCGDAVVGSSPLCFESNGVPFFVENAGTDAEALQALYPNTTLSFGLVDYYATHDAWDAGGGTTYHVDIGKFVNSTQFGHTVIETIQRTLLGGGFIVPNSDLLQNFLDSDSISAMYAALQGWGGINWTNSAHHVIVQVGSTAPRDPSYPENYCVSPAVTPRGLTNCTAPICEPSTTILKNATPACEGWILSQSGDSTASIAALAHVAPSCANSLGGNCTIDEINLNGTPTNPKSPSWSAAGGSGGPANWTADASNILQAGCDMASSTGGTWDGPSWFTCQSLKTKGDLGYVPIGYPADPQTSNGALLNALGRLGLGEVPNPVVATGANQPMFEFLPWGNFAAAPIPNFRVACANATGVGQNCPSAPTFLTIAGVTAFGWNWSNQPALNVMHLGDTWQASFSIDATGPPFGLLPVDACTTLGCIKAGSGTVGQSFTSITFREYGGANLVTESFPLGQVIVDPLTEFSVPVAAPLPVLPGSAPIQTPPPSSPLVPPTPAPPIPAAAISVEAAAAGFIAAGLVRMGIRQPPMGTKQASVAGPISGKKRKKTRGSPPYRWID
ncbi:MAG: hypothetical protein L3J97_01790 [Thermoplasmata archaeon]|nr:hypothetical protein [Thermoplasmata archaeon]